MKAGNGFAVALTAVVLAFGCAPAAAAAATIVITSPPAQSTTHAPQPTFEGTTSDVLDPVSLAIHKGSSASGALAQPAVSTSPSPGGSWSAVPESPLEDGTYTAVAEQTEPLAEPSESNAVTFTVDTAPEVTLTAPETPSGHTRPTFTGTASDTTQVTVDVYAGSSAGGTPLAEATASGTGAGFTTGPTEPALESGEYTAVAVQHSSIGSGVGRSEAVHFVIDTHPPTVTLQSPESPSNHTRPFFTGFASDTEPVTVKVYAGTTVKGAPVAEASAAGTGGTWTSEAVNAELQSGTYTAQASQPSSLGNSPGVSEPVTFVIETQAPRVSLDQPRSPSNNTLPSFTGTASDETTVTIDVYAGPLAEGPVVASAAATGTGGAWSSGKVDVELAGGEYTAVASQESSLLGNPTGFSSPVSFVIDTSSPKVTLKGPATPSNNTKPTFSGTASDTTQVVVEIDNEQGQEVETATASPSGGHWSTSNEDELPSGSYTALATEESSLHNPPGESTRVAFTIDTEPPTVSLSAPSLRSNDRTPSFSGTASDIEPVTVHVYEGSKPEGDEVGAATATVSSGSFATAPLSPALPAGVHTYTAIATEPSSLHNRQGESKPVTFTVDTSSPTVTLAQPPSPSNDTTPSFSGTASDTEPVQITIYAGEKPEGTIVSSAEAHGTGGSWTSTAASPALATGAHKYTAVATQNSSLGNSPGSSAPVTFTVNTNPPKVVLDPVTTPSNQTTPSFTGTASDATPVTVQIYSGTRAEGTPVASASATHSGSAWSSAAAAPALSGTPAHVYTAVAEQPSAIPGNPIGRSEPVSFEVDTTSPSVTITGPSAGSISRDQEPSFSGTATGSGTGQVHIRVLEGGASGPEVASATATVSAGRWTSNDARPPLASGAHTYTAVASEESRLGNAPGSSEVSFSVNTLAPTVTLKAPPPVSGDTTPSFQGEASDTRPVLVDIYRGVGRKALEGRPVATAEAPGSGGTFTGQLAPWESRDASPALTRGEYTAVASQESSLGNGSGKSAPVTFTIDPGAPTVTLTAPAALSNDTTPSFSGETTDWTPVTVNICPGWHTAGCKTPVATATTGNGAPGIWTSEPVLPPLAEGRYTAQAEQTSQVGETGKSEEAIFTVDTTPPQVSVTGAQPLSGDSAVVSGTAGTAEHDLRQVTVQLFAGSTIGAGALPEQTVSLDAEAGSWSATFGGLGAGSYTARAEQRDEAGNLAVSNTVSFTLGSPAPPSAPAAPTAAFSWLPVQPRAGESVSLVSSSSDATSPLVGFAWETNGGGAFAAAGPELTTSFASSGDHTVRLRVTAADGLSNVAAETIPVGPALLPLMAPFPIVRITTFVTRTGARIALLSVMAAPGSAVTVRCSGHGCPVKRVTRAVAAGSRRAQFIAFRRFERALPAGVTLRISVTRAGTVGKWTKLIVRRSKPPVRSDACLQGTTITPVPCP